MFPVEIGAAEKIANAIQDWTGDHTSPKRTSLDAETHLFHYSEVWDDSPIIFINKNGNQQRLVRDGNYWHAYATWRDVLPLDSWEFKGLQGDDPERVIAKMSVGPGPGKNETLCFLPKDANCVTAGRILVYRYHMLSMRKARRSDTFTLMDRESRTVSPEFPGKPWESLSAARWVRDELGVDDPPLIRGVAGNPFTREKEQEAVAAALEEHELFGAWG